MAEEQPLSQGVVRGWKEVQLKSGPDQARQKSLDWALGRKIHALLDPEKTGTVLGQGPARDLQFEWLITPWTECSQRCGHGQGFRVSSAARCVECPLDCLCVFQLRSAHCVVRLDSASESVESSLCEAAGLELPSTRESCGGGDCAEWVLGDWSPCLRSKCVAWHSALQRRSVHCAKNGTRVADQECGGRGKPRLQRECYSEQCKAVWRVQAWTEVSGEEGERERGGESLTFSVPCSAKESVAVRGPGTGE